MFKKFAIIIMTLVICGCICGCTGNADVANAYEPEHDITVDAVQVEVYNTKIIVSDEICDTDYTIEMYAQDGLWHVKLRSRVDERDPGIAGCYNWNPSAEDIEELWDMHIQNWNEFNGN